MLNATPKKDNIALTIEHHQGAENGTRTRDPDLGKVVLYQLSYFRNILPCLEEHLSRLRVQR